ncbi:MAG: PDZ domain-containing protein [Coriobacteriales bacterium]|jgi:carboxyl-terminal processing protease|nr:PDZ domain-containing protein [Coriobacteriales bacterium]
MGKKGVRTSPGTKEAEGSQVDATPVDAEDAEGVRETEAEQSAEVEQPAEDVTEPASEPEAASKRKAASRPKTASAVEDARDMTAAIDALLTAPPRHTARQRRRRALRRFGSALLTAFLWILLFSAGNLGAYFGFIDVGRMLEIRNPQSQSAASPSDEVASSQLASRLSEVALALDTEALYSYTQGDLDTATTTAIRGLIETSADEYAHYYTPEEYAAYLKSSEGEYAGIGVVFTTLNNEVTVLQVYGGSPAADAGIRPGDVLLAVDGDRHAWTIDEATEAIRRPRGESVRLIWRQQGAEHLTTMVLREVNIPTIVTHLIERGEASVGYIYLRRFTTHSANEVRLALASLEGQGAQSFILDVRGNPGGYLTQAKEITSLFVPKGTVVQIQDRNGITASLVSGKTATDKPLAVLVSGASASASELVSAALQDHGRAIVVGEVTYGKGTVQDIRELSWGGALKYTIAHYLSPNGRALDGVGVTPDIVVAPGELAHPLGLTDYLTGSDYRYAEGIDLQLDAALGALAAQTVAADSTLAALATQADSALTVATAAAPPPSASAVSSIATVPRRFAQG